MNIKINDIVINNRKRKLNEDKVKELAESMKLIGQLEPITVTSGNVLLAGLHRVEAAKKLGWDEIKAELFEGNEVECELAEIDENLMRNDLTVLEQGEHLARRQELIGFKQGDNRFTIDRGRTVLPLKTTSEIAHDIGLTESSAQKRMQAARNIVPEVKDAIRDTEIANSTTQLLELARLSPDKQIEVSGLLKDNTTVSWAKREIAHKTLNKIKREKVENLEDNRPIIQLADIYDWLPDKPQCDLLITDPPYMTDIENVQLFSRKWLPVALAKVKDTGRAYVCIGPYPEELKAYLNVEIPDHMILANILPWTYRNTLGPSPKYDYKNNWQAILYFRGVNAPELNCPIMIEQFTVQDIPAPDGRQGDRYHKWQKPDELARRLISHSTKEGDLVFDPFAGTGTFLIEASKAGRIAMGCDLSDEMISIAEQRGCKRA